MRKNKIIDWMIFRYAVVFSVALIIFSCQDKDSADFVPPSLPDEPQTTLDLREGITVLSDDSLAFVLFAPGKKVVHLIGDFNNWEISDNYRMQKIEDDKFMIRIGNLSKDKEYVCQYLIDFQLRVADPYATLIADPDNDKYIPETVYPNLPKYPTGKTSNITMVVSTGKSSYSWNAKDFKVSNPDNMVIYELLIRDFTEEGTIKAVEAKLPYLKSLGVNAIELMPFNEFEGNVSWGYNPSFYFAADKAYGTQNDYKSFIDKCHTNGIAVIMDMVLNHSYDQNPMVQMYKKVDGKLSVDNPWFNVESPNTEYSWGQDFNHESKYTQAFVDSVCSFWMSEYKVDGFRFDFTKGFTNTSGDGWAKDDARIAILKRMTDEIKKRKNDAIVIFEHLTDNEEEKILANHGIYLWGNMNGSYNEATMGYDGNDLSWTSYATRGWESPKLISYMESHDEERIMFKNLAYGKEHNGYSVKYIETALARTEAAAVIYMTVPGPKMIWQFGERGYDIELNDDRLAPKPPHWEYMDVSARKHMYDVYAEMIKLRQTNPTFTTTNFDLGIGKGYLKQILLKGADGKDVCTIANFDVVTQTMEVNFGSAGEWTDHFTNEKLTVTAPKQTVELKPGEYRLYKK